MWTLLRRWLSLDDRIRLGTIFAGYVLDIKDLIIIAGSIFFVLIVAHGLWEARRHRDNEIRMDIKASDTKDDHSSDLSDLSPDFPNGGARVISQALNDESVETASEAKSSGAPTKEDEEESEDTNELAHEAVTAVSDDQTQPRVEPNSTTPRTDDLFKGAEAPLVSENRVAANKKPEKSQAQRRAKQTRSSNTSAQTSAAKATKATRATKIEAAPDDPRRQNPQLEELLILGVMAKPDAPFGGDDLVAALRGQGLKFGDMGIFHRTQSDSGERLFSVANAVEPGTFDLSDLAALQSPGLTFFMQLPVPGDALETLDDMILSARTVAAALGGDVKDDTMSALTGQTVEHLKQRIADFARKQLTASSDG